MQGVAPCAHSLLPRTRTCLLSPRTTKSLPLFYRVGSSAYSASKHARRSFHSTMPTHAERTLPAWFTRGGTSNGLVLRRQDLPADESQWGRIIAPAMGSPDPTGRQLNGIGSGISSTSKVIVLGEPTRPDVDVDYTFIQVGIKDGKLDKAGNCGNMSSTVGPAAWDHRMVKKLHELERDDQGRLWATVRFFNTNTSKVIHSRFRVSGDEENSRYDPDGDFAIDGVAGTASQITLSFLDPAGAKTGKALPTGNPVDVLTLPDGTTVEASLVDVSNPGVFISAASLSTTGGADVASLAPPDVDADEPLKTRLEQIRRAGALAMGLDPDSESVPKVVILSPSRQPGQVAVQCLAMSMGQAHKAVPLTLSLCLGAACQMEGTLAHSLAQASGPAPKDGIITVGHPSGTVDVGTVFEGGQIKSAQLLRTARFLMKGQVLY